MWELGICWTGSKFEGPISRVPYPTWKFSLPLLGTVGSYLLHLSICQRKVRGQETLKECDSDSDPITIHLFARCAALAAEGGA